MSDLRFGWLGESRQKALQSLLFDGVMEWSRDWWTHHAATKVDVRGNEHPRHALEAAVSWVSINPLGSLVLYVDTKRMREVGHHLAGIEDKGSGGWAQLIGERALEDLATRIFRCARIATHSPLSQHEGPFDWERADRGSCGVTIALAGVKWALIMDRQLADLLVPPRKRQQADLVLRESAVNNVLLRVNAIIDFGSVNLSHLSDLCVGEVLVGDRGLDETLQVQVDGYGAVAGGYLRRMGTQYAVVLDGVNSQEKSKP